jgi:hypothetical protein
MIAMLVTPAFASATRPTILSITGSSTVSWRGGTEVLSVKTRSAVACSVEVHNKPGLSVKLPKGLQNCGKGTLRLTMQIGANPYTVRVPVVFWVLANDHGVTVNKSFTVTVGKTTSVRSTGGGSSPTTTTTLPPPVVNLDACSSPGPNCYYGPIYASYQTYGNTAPDTLGDCAFAAAANWEQIVLKADPDPSVIGYEFAEAGGTASGGLAQSALWTYWQNDGIAGIYLTGLHSYYTDQTDVENGVRAYGAMIIELNFVQGTYFGNMQIAVAGYHDAVVDGYTPEGPLVVSWGETIQMTWAQWNNEIVGMWGIGASSS